MKVLVTGASGYVGSRLIQVLSKTHDIIALSRKRVEYDQRITWIEGQFHSKDDLHKLDTFQIDCVIHLAAVTAGFEESYTINTNASGTLCLLRYCVDRGCKKFILASSIAAVGCLSESFLPLTIPIQEEHPCIPADAYGISKALVEEIAGYFCRSNLDLSISILRYGAIKDFSTWRPPAETVFQKPFLKLSSVDLEDVVEATTLIAEKQTPPGIRNYNIVSPVATCEKPTGDVLLSSLGKRIEKYDLSYYAKQGMEHAPVYSIEKLQSDFDFIPKRIPDFSNLK